MLYHSKNGSIPMGDTSMDYARFGTGKQYLIMLPGLGDGLRSVKGTALPMALLYRMFAKDYTVFMFSRRQDIPQGFTTRDMARDLASAMDILGIPRADILGVSMGGMIAQHLAADHPEKVGKLILAVTAPCANPRMTECVSGWLEDARRGDHTALMDSNLRLIYSETYYRQNKWMVPIIGKLTKPASYSRFFAQAEACLTHNSLAALAAITCPTLVIGGEQDLVLGADPSRQIAAAIDGAMLHIYPMWGHGLYEEAKDFNPLVLSFFKA